MKRKQEIIIGIIVIIVTVIILGYILVENINKKENSIESIDTNIELDNSDEDIDWSNYEIKNLTLTESITITEEGIYELSGEITNGMVTVNTKGNVKLILNNATITNESGPAIYIKNAKNTVIYLKEETTNTLEDSSNYQTDEDINATIYSKDNLIFDGSGTLVIKANYQDGIVSKDNLKIKNGTFNITSIDDNIKGKDSVYIIDGNFNITAGGDGIKSTNTSDKNKGYVYIENGNFEIDATLDGIQAETKLLIKNGNYTIKTGNGSTNNSKKDTWGNWGKTDSTDTKSAKGLKACNNIVIEDGTFNLNTSDDSIHSNNYIGISNGTYSISSGDDGIHADNEIIIEGGSIDIKESYEGIEAAKITIYNGDISVVVSDDGINVAGGDGSSYDRPGSNNFSGTTGTLKINGGNIVVNASGDGLDANGNIYITGGNTIIYGPTDNGNGALDYDGVLEITDGSLIASGSSGMAQMPGEDSSINSVMINFNQTITSDKVVTIKNSSDEEIINYKADKSYTNLVISNDKLSNGDYTIYIDNEKYDTFTTSGIITKVGNTQNANMMTRDDMRRPR